MPAADFVSTFKKPLVPPVILSPPRLRITQAARSWTHDVEDSTLVPKSRHRVRQPDAQAKKVVMKHLGVEGETQLLDEASFEELQTVFALPLFPSTREEK